MFYAPVVAYIKLPGLFERISMKCCGNCKNNGVVKQGLVMREENCRIGVNVNASWQVCDFWEYDNVSDKDRKI